MLNEKDMQFLQMTYAAVLADATSQFAQEGVLQSVVKRKKTEQMATGKMKAGHFGITSPETVFTRLAEVFNCAAWKIQRAETNFVAETTTCKLCAIAKKMNERRDYHNERLAVYCQENEVSLADICTHLRDEHFGDELHPNEAGARIIAEQVFSVLSSVLEEPDG